MPSNVSKTFHSKSLYGLHSDSLQDSSDSSHLGDEYPVHSLSSRWVHKRLSNWNPHCSRLIALTVRSYELIERLKASFSSFLCIAYSGSFPDTCEYLYLLLYSFDCIIQPPAGYEGELIESYNEDRDNLIPYHHLTAS